MRYFGEALDIMAASYNVVSVTITCDSPEVAYEEDKYLPNDGKVTSLDVGAKMEVAGGTRTPLAGIHIVSTYGLMV